MNSEGALKTHWRHSLEGPSGPAMEERTDLWRIHFLVEEGDKAIVVQILQMTELVITLSCVAQIHSEHGKMELPQC